MADRSRSFSKSNPNNGRLGAPRWRASSINTAVAIAFAPVLFPLISGGARRRTRSRGDSAPLLLTLSVRADDSLRCHPRFPLPQSHLYMSCRLFGGGTDAQPRSTWQ